MKAVSDALNVKLSADATLTALAPVGVHARRAPLDTLPAVVYTKQSGREHYTLKQRAYRALVYLVKAIAQTQAAGQSADERIDALLSDGTITPTGQTVMRIRRTTDVEFSETAAEGRVYWHVGALYAIEVTPG